jgi:hypothetical protein
MGSEFFRTSLRYVLCATLLFGTTFLFVKSSSRDFSSIASRLDTHDYERDVVALLLAVRKG